MRIYLGKYTTVSEMSGIALNIMNKKIQYKYYFDNYIYKMKGNLLLGLIFIAICIISFLFYTLF